MEKQVQVVQDIQFATPLFVVALSEISDDCNEAMKELCSSQFPVSSKNFPNLIETCNKYDVKVPDSIVVQPIFCPSINDLIENQKSLDAEEYHIFLKWYCTIAFIDYSVNKNIDETRNFFLECSDIKPDRCNFVIYQATESLFQYHTDTTCVCFDTFTKQVSISCIQDFIARGIQTTIIKLLDYGFNDMKLEPKLIRESKVRADFAGISGNTPTFLSQVKNAMKELEGTTYYGIMGSFCEICALMELRTPDITHKLYPSNVPPSAFHWLPSFTQRSLQFYIAAANFYNKGMCCAKCIDCGIRLVVLGFKEAIQPVAYYITNNWRDEGVMKRSWDLLNVVSRFGMLRKAALVASEFSKTFEQTDTGNTFTLFALKVLLKDSSSSSLVQIRDLCIPMILKLLEEKEKVPMKLYSRFLSKTMSAIGPALDTDKQIHLFNELESHTCVHISLPLIMKKMSVDQLSYSISEKETHKRSASGVFLYSYLQNNDTPFSNYKVDIKHSITFSTNFYNPFAITLKAENVHLISDSSVTCDSTTVYFEPNKNSLVRSHLTPHKAGDVIVKGISMQFFGAQQDFLLKEPIVLSAVADVPNFHLRTDLPLSSNLTLFDGEIHDFTIWITNLGEHKIDNLEVNFLQPELGKLIEPPELPIPAFGQATIRCAVFALKGEEYLAAKVVASCNQSSYCCSQNIRQKLVINDALEICRLFLMTTPPRGEKSHDKVFIGYEVRNNGSCSFMYESRLCGVLTKGLIGQNESLMMVGSYNPSELISNGSDANKSKLISMTKQKESEIGRSLSLSQRSRVAMCVSMLQRLMDKWNFTWTVSSIRKGQLISKMAAVDDELFNGIESRQIQVKVSWFNDDNQQEVTDVMIDSKYALLVEFDKEMINCSIDLTPDGETDDETTIDILWEGELNQHDEQGKKTFQFILCFGAAKPVKFFIYYTSITGIEGQTTILVPVKE